jgi:hypothetical protein
VAGDVGTHGYKVIHFPISLYINICRNMDMYITATPNAKEKTMGGIAWGHEGTGWVNFRPRDRHQSHVPPTNTPK